MDAIAGAAEESSEMQRHEGFGERRRRRFTLGRAWQGAPELLAPIAAGTCVERDPCPSQRYVHVVASGRADFNVDSG